MGTTTIITFSYQRMVNIYCFWVTFSKLIICSVYTFRGHLSLKIEVFKNWTACLYPRAQHNWKTHFSKKIKFGILEAPHNMWMPSETFFKYCTDGVSTGPLKGI